MNCHNKVLLLFNQRIFLFPRFGVCLLDWRFGCTKRIMVSENIFEICSVQRIRSNVSFAYRKEKSSDDGPWKDGKNVGDGRNIWNDDSPSHKARANAGNDSLVGRAMKKYDNLTRSNDHERWSCWRCCDDEARSWHNFEGDCKNMDPNKKLS